MKTSHIVWGIIGGFVFSYLGPFELMMESFVWASFGYESIKLLSIVIPIAIVIHAWKRSRSFAISFLITAIIFSLCFFGLDWLASNSV